MRSHYLEPVTSYQIELHLNFMGGLSLLIFYKKLHKLKSVVTARNREACKAALLGWWCQPPIWGKWHAIPDSKCVCKLEGFGVDEFLKRACLSIDGSAPVLTGIWIVVLVELCPRKAKLNSVLFQVLGFNPLRIWWLYFVALSAQQWVCDYMHLQLNK